MFARIATVSSLVFALSALASPAIDARGGSDGGSQCNTGSLQCCTTTGSATSSSITGALGLLGIVLGPVEGLVGLGCTPITVVGAGSGATCTQEPVCCTGNEYNGLVNIGCSPINLNL
ncbi:fungal hydrophobin [Leucogyrophana mollusca]|uniref:Fungal hydrophobin n=1 Tax=Leucogyrophana mollusca TaxID=85980 RepID=A0ACB8B109_9AGAM|nr:fungal hydrophobin [Leucogyrophana mollusca]